MGALTVDPWNLVITGVGGQGNVLISQILGRALLAKGFMVTVGETFGLSQRGGSVQSHIRVSEKRVYGPLIPEGRAHAVLGLEPIETLRVLPVYGQPAVKVLVNGRAVPPLNVSAGQAVYPSDNEIKGALSQLADMVWWVMATQAARELGSAIMANIVMLGALSAAGQAPVTADDLEKAMEEVLPQDKVFPNIQAFRKGTGLIQ